MDHPSLERDSAVVPARAPVEASPSSRAVRHRGRWPVVAQVIGALLLALVSAGCDTLGASCEETSDCDDGQICGDPQGTDASICFIPCESDSECEEDPGGGSTCQILPQASSGYCSAAD